MHCGVNDNYIDECMVEIMQYCENRLQSDGDIITK